MANGQANKANGQANKPSGTGHGNGKGAAGASEAPADEAPAEPGRVKGTVPGS